MDTVAFLTRRFTRRIFRTITVIVVSAAILAWLYFYGLPAAFDQVIENSKNFKIG